MPITRIQGGVGFAGGPAGSTTFTWGAAISSGSTVVALAFCNSGTVTDFTVTDSQSNAYTGMDMLFDSPRNARGKAFILGNITNAPTNITVNCVGGTGTNVTILCDEFSGCQAAADPRDGHTSNQQVPSPTGTDAITSTSITTTVNGDLIWCANYDTGIASGGVNAGTGFTYTTGSNPFSENLIQSTAGSIAGTWTYNNASDAQTFVVAVKPAGAVQAPFVQNIWPNPTAPGQPVRPSTFTNIANQPSQQTTQTVLMGSICT